MPHGQQALSFLQHCRTYHEGLCKSSFFQSLHCQNQTGELQVLHFDSQEGLTITWTLHDPSIALISLMRNSLFSMHPLPCNHRPAPLFTQCICSSTDFWHLIFWLH